MAVSVNKTMNVFHCANGLQVTVPGCEPFQYMEVPMDGGQCALFAYKTSKAHPWGTAHHYSEVAENRQASFNFAR
jgi:hypothetical protein